MYTGIVQGLEKVIDVRQGNGFRSFVIANTQHFFDDVFIGASVAINGVCLTVTQIESDLSAVHFDISDLSLQLTNLKHVRAGDEVNIERSAKVGAENGGHNLYGHVEGTAKVLNVTHHGEILHVDLEIPNGNIKYFFMKGFIGLNGCSLTINQIDRNNNHLAVDLIPETQRLTTWKYIQAGDEVNYEIDQTTRTLVDTLEHIHSNK